MSKTQENTNFKTLDFKKTKNKIGMTEYRANVRVKGVFGIRFYYSYNWHAIDSSKTWSYGWIVNGKWYGRKYGSETLFCSTEKECINMCQSQYEEICSNILNEIIKDKGEN